MIEVVIITLFILIVTMLVRVYGFSYTFVVLCLGIVLVLVSNPKKHEFMRESFAQIATFNTETITKLASVPSVIQERITTGIDYIIKAQEQAMKSDSPGSNSKESFVGLTRESLGEEENTKMTDADISRLGLQYLAADHLLQELKKNHPTLYQRVMGNFKPEDPYEKANEEMGLI